VGHHGSAYSSSPRFVAAVHPKFALVSVGRHNLIGHPAATTLATLRSAGAQTYRTDICGATIVEAGLNVRSTTMLRCSVELQHP
jgi:competence protein ComEC